MLRFDSDTMLITNNIHLIKAAKKNYFLFKVSTCSVNAKKLKRKYTNEEKYDLDYKTSNNLIGEIVNLAAILNSKMFEMLNSGASQDDIQQINYDVCQLNVLSGLQIDAAKKEFDLNFDKELKTIRARHDLKDDDKKNIKPYFFYYILSYKDLLNTDHDTFVKQNTTMDLLEEIINSLIRGKEYRFNSSNEEPLKFYEILKDTNENEVVSKKLYNKVYNLLKDYNSHVDSIYASKLDNVKKRTMFEIERYTTLRKIRDIKLNNSTIIYLLKQLDTKKNNYLYKRCFNMLFCTQDTPYMNVIQESQERLPRIRQNDYGDINLLGTRYKKVGDF